MKKLSDAFKRHYALPKRCPVCENKESVSEEKMPELSELPNGTYKALFYAWVLELEDGRMFHTPYGVRHGRHCASWKQYKVEDGEMKEVLPNGCVGRISELQDGVYKALFYDSVLELEDGRKYATNYGVKHGRDSASWMWYKVNGIVVTEVGEHFNGVDNHVSKLPDGEYRGRWYAHCLELEDGSKYFTDEGVLRSRDFSPLENFVIIGGKITEK